ncbi:MAG TPA: hypothetical protein VMT64_13345, partial [Candidatus Binataceae bacterium]|nr:hypothetical protein [Candidatus Binataceae bacterium]
MGSRPVHFVGGAVAAVLLVAGIISMPPGYPQADPPTPSGARACLNDPSTHRRYAEYLAGKRGVAFGVPRDGYAKAVAAMHEMERRAGTIGAPAATATPMWTSLGPLPITNQTPLFGNVPVGSPLANAGGRVTAIATDPTTSGRLFVGTAGGGVWMSTNGGAGFTPIFDAQPTLAIGAIALDPTTTPPTIYVGTGEANNTVDSIFGEGLFISTNLGGSWTQQTAGGAFIGMSFARIAIDTTQTPRILYAAVSSGSSSNRAGNNFIDGNIVNNGLWKSVDGGTTWFQISFTSQTACPGFGGFCPAEDVAIDPVIPSNLFVSIYQFGVFSSHDHGSTWQAISLPGISNNQIGRASITARNNNVYIAAGAADGIEYQGFFRAADGGFFFIPIATPSANLSGTTIDGSSSANFSAADFDQTFAIDSADSSSATVIFGGVGIYRSTDNGNHWTFIGQNGGVGAGQHAVAIDPFNSGHFFVGNDAGLFSYNPASGAWTALNAGVSTAIIQSVAPNNANNNLMLAGAADNGTVRLSANSVAPQPWSAVDQGAGGFALYDKVNPNFAYHSFMTATNGVVDLVIECEAG